MREGRAASERGPPRLVGPAGCEQRPPSAWPAGPSQEAGYVCRSVGGGLINPGDWSELQRSVLRAGRPGRQPGPGHLARPRRLASRPESRPHGSHTFGPGRVGQTLWRIFQRREGGKSQRPPLASSSTSGQGLAAETCPGRSLPHGYPLARVALRHRSFPPSLGGGSRAGGASGLREADPPLCPCPGRTPVAGHSFPDPATVRTVLIHSGREELDKPPGGFFKGGKGGRSPRPPRAPAPPPGLGTGTRRRVLPETAHRLGPLTVPRRGESPRSPPSSTARREEGKVARGGPGLQKHRFWSVLDRFFGSGSPADRATSSGMAPPCAPLRDGSGEPWHVPLRPS